ncbi:uncharacterized protein LOC119586744, partial [Penaeus monodon]|uniref:uncharacterized protein LOC119586744 n=1 Tax=Penaeus monodon TaxID=6687 RepID=UPI0018A72529
PPPPPAPPPPPPPPEAVRAVIPFCSGSGYLNLVQRLRKLVSRNNGRPLNPVAASLAVAVNYCKFGLGVRPVVPPAPPSPAIGRSYTRNSYAQPPIFLDDQEAQVAKTPPKRWPGIVSYLSSFHRHTHTRARAYLCINVCIYAVQTPEENLLRHIIIPFFICSLIPVSEMAFPARSPALPWQPVDSKCCIENSY